MTDDKIWQAVLGEMEVVMPKMQFLTWFRDTSLSLTDKNSAIVYVPNNFAKDWLQKNKGDDILACLKKINDQVNSLEIKIQRNGSTDRLALEIKAETPPKQNIEDSNNTGPLNKEYIFGNFVVGNNNSLAYAVAREVASKPGQLHNPLFIYGGVGLGKTHLAQAIGQEIKKNNPKTRLSYVSCETFTNDFINAIASRKMAQFKKNYRDVDVLIVDDIQFLSSKEGSQEEFFHTFNALQQKSRQIILTADKTPQAIPALEGRLASRFGGGMIVDIQPPNLETRIAILSEKCKEKDAVLPEEVIEYIAKNVSSNIRELEGALNRLLTYCKFNSTPATTKIASQVLKDIVASSNRSVDTADIVSAVCKYFSLSKDEILGKGRKKELMRPRQIAIFLIREQTNKSLPEIGKIMGGKDHTTILHSERKISDDLKSDSGLKDEIEALREMILSPK